MERIKIGISTCLLGEKVRYDGGHKLDRYITETLGQFFEYVPVCPEVEYGLPVPREPLRLVGDPGLPRLVTSRTGVDHTAGMIEWAEKRLRELDREDLCGFIFKSRSPSSGLKGVKVYTPSGMPSRSGVGIFAAAFTRRNPLLPVVDDGRLNDPSLRETFINAVLVYRRWQRFLKSSPSPKELVSLHTVLKLLIMAHSPKHYTMLGKIVARAGSLKKAELHSYGTLLMEALSFQATRPKNTNVLLHSAGYFKKLLTRDEKEELLEIISRYQKGYVPLVVPMTLINHYIRKYRDAYLGQQFYFDLEPVELMLKNQV